MTTVHISLGEIIEATYADLTEQFGDRELAYLATQALVAELLGVDDADVELAIAV